MKSGVVIIVTGGIMIICGLIMFYGIQSMPQPDMSQKNLFVAIKHGGTFVGLLGIGVIIAGFLLYLINRRSPPIHEDYDVHPDLSE